MLNDNWPAILAMSLCFVAVANGLLASCTRIYYTKKRAGELSHSQLRIKQGNATFEHRLNAFAHYFSCSFFSLKVYIAALFLWLAINLALHYHVLF